MLLMIFLFFWGNTFFIFAYDIEVNGFYFNVLSTTTLEVTSGEKKYSGDISIPETIIYNSKSYNVVAVGEKAFYECENLKSIYMSNKIQEIGDYAFFGCSSLKSFTFSTSNIGKYVFANCTSLTKAKLNLKIIPDGMFMGCTSLTEYSLTCWAIGNYAFKGCTSLKGDFSFKNVCFGREAFADCTGITSLSITPSDWTKGGTRVVFRDAFKGCTSLKKVSISPYDYNSESTLDGIGFGFADCENLDEILTENLKNYQSVDGVLYANNNKNLSFLPPNHSVIFVVPDDVKQIQQYAFSTKGKLQRIVFGSSKISLEKGVFSKCPDLKELYCYSKTPENFEFSIPPEEIKEGWFHPDLVGKLKVYVPLGCKSYYEKVWPWKDFLIEEFDVVSFDPYATKVNGINYKIISDTECEVAHRDDYSGNIDIPESVSIKGKNYKVTSIGDNAFKDCYELYSISIPNNITSSGYNAFYGCNGLTSVKIKDLEAWCKISFKGEDSNPLFYAKHLFLNNEEIKKLVIPNSISCIGDCSFIGLSSCSSITIPNEVTRIGYGAFLGCSSIEEIILPEKIKRIEARTFFGCKKLKTITIPESVEYIGELAFHSCWTLKSVIVGNNVKDIRHQAFAHCWSLKEIVLGEAVERIGYECFQISDSIETVYSLNPVPPILDFKEGLAEYYWHLRDNTFTSSQISKINLYVPLGSLEHYKISWGYSFKNYYEIDSKTFDPKTLGIKTMQIGGIESSYFSVDGKKLNEPTKGINIIRMNDGTAKKVIVK